MFCVVRAVHKFHSRLVINKQKKHVVQSYSCFWQDLLCFSPTVVASVKGLSTHSVQVTFLLSKWQYLSPQVLRLGDHCWQERGERGRKRGGTYFTTRCRNTRGTTICAIFVWPSSLLYFGCLKWVSATAVTINYQLTANLVLGWSTDPYIQKALVP